MNDSAWTRWAEHDRSWTLALHRAALRPWVVRVLAPVSRLSDGVLWYVAIMLLPWVGGTAGTACALRMVIAGALGLLVYSILKRHFARPRPCVACPDVQARARPLDEFSFPSGHTLHAVAFSMLLVAYYPVLTWVAWPFTGLVALSRVVLGLHYPSDVLVGAAIGASIAAATLCLV